jgi:O-antigen ligase
MKGERKPKETSPLEMAPAVLFTAVVIVFVRMYSYTRNMKQFYWSGRVNNLSEYFSHYKVVFILVSAALAVIALLYRGITRRLVIKRSLFYYPMGLYAILAALSFAFSPHKDFAWHGWIERFEGTYVLLCYMFMLFYIINTVNTERNVKQIIYALAVVSALLSLIGISQYLNHDFFRTVMGQCLIVPNTATSDGSTFWRQIAEAGARGETLLKFKFGTMIYQTVYNPNYVSFYLTLLIPLFIMLFINEKVLVKKWVWGVLFSLVMINLIGSASSSGFLGMFVAVVVALILLNKRLITRWKSVVILLFITALTAVVTGKTWFPEISSAVRMALPKTAAPVTEDGEQRPFGPPTKSEYFEYIVTEKDTIHLRYAGSTMTITINNIDDPDDFTVRDGEGEAIALEKRSIQMPGSDLLYKGYGFSDPRYAGLTLMPAQTDGTKGFKHYLVINNTLPRPSNAITTWSFALTKGGVLYQNYRGMLVSLKNVPHIGWEKNLQFGSNRGYIWSRTVPLLKDTLILGHGADTYALYFPHNDYVGQGIANWPPGEFIDKPHNFYLGVGINTGVLSLICLLTLYLLYIVQSFRLYRRETYETFCPIVGTGIFIGICGFLAAAFFNDSTVSVTPMFYGLLGTGIAVNMLVKGQRTPESD